MADDESDDDLYGTANATSEQKKHVKNDDDGSSGDEPMDEGQDSGEDDDNDEEEDSESVCLESPNCSLNYHTISNHPAGS